MTKNPNEGANNDPVIRSALGPAAKHFGQEVRPLGKEAGEVTVRAVRVGLRAVSGMVWGFEQIADYVQRTVAEKLKDVPEEKIVEANPRIAVPALEALRYSGNETDIREMFASLIAADLNSDTKRHAHPSFVEMIKQMSTEDAKLLKATDAEQGAILYQGHLHLKKDDQAFSEVDLMLTVNVPGMLLDQHVKAAYSLARLGLLRISETMSPAGTVLEKVEAYKESERHKDFLKQFEAVPDFKFRDHKVGIFLTPLGKDFARACL